jgi:sec-independent protein translocase protein TatB
MFEISWSELLILAIVTLIFVGPKELPVFLRTLGRYAGSIKRQANEFRSQFDAAMREAELDAVTKEFETMQASVNVEVMGAKQSLNEAVPYATPLERAHQAVAAVAAEKVEPALPMPPMPATPSMGS